MNTTLQIHCETDCALKTCRICRRAIEVGAVTYCEGDGRNEVHKTCGDMEFERERRFAEAFG